MEEAKARQEEERKKQEAEIAFEKYHDQLHGLAEKRAYAEAVARANEALEDAKLAPLKQRVAQSARACRILLAFEGACRRNLPKLKGKTMRLKGMSGTVVDSNSTSTPGIGFLSLCLTDNPIPTLCCLCIF